MAGVQLAQQLTNNLVFKGSNPAQMTKKKSFFLVYIDAAIVMRPGACTIKLFTAVIYEFS